MCAALAFLMLVTLPWEHRLKIIFNFQAPSEKKSFVMSQSCISSLYRATSFIDLLSKTSLHRNAQVFPETQSIIIIND